MFIVFLWSRECIGTAHRHEIAVTVDKWYLLVLVTRLAFPLQGKTQTTKKLAHPATLTILGSKVSTCFRRAFMVFPVSTMAWGEGRAKEERKRFGGKNVGYIRVKKRSRYSTMQKSWATTDFFIFCLPGGGRFFCTFKVFQALWRSFKLCLWTLAGFHVFSPCTRPSEEFWDNLWAACHKNTFHYEKCQR